MGITFDKSKQNIRVHLGGDFIPSNFIENNVYANIPRRYKIRQR